MDKQKTIPIQLDISTVQLATLANDLKKLNDGLEKSCGKGVFGMKETQSLCGSIENFEQLLHHMAQLMNQTIEKTEKKDKKNNEKIEQMD